MVNKRCWDDVGLTALKHSGLILSMNGENFLRILGTAGARFVVAKQLRSSAGTFIRINGKNVILDPGPGTLVKCSKSKPVIDTTSIDAIILTHLHIDHSNDVNILIDAMTGGGINKRGILFSPYDCLNGDNYVVLKYLRDFLEDIVVLRSQQDYHFGDVTFSTSVRHLHDVETYGIKFIIDGRKLSFMVDTKFFPELIDSYKDTDIMVMNVVQYNPSKFKVMHLCIDDVKKILSAIKPKKTILTHFGMTMLKAKPWIIAKQLAEELQMEIIAASDGMTVELFTT